MHNADTSPCEADKQTQCAALTTLLVEHPVQLTSQELLRRLVLDIDDFVERDAVSELYGTSWPRPPSVGPVILPASPIIYFDQLGCY